MSQKVLSYDLGGTKLEAGVVNSRGKVLDEIRVPALFHQGKKAVLQQIFDLGKKFLSQHKDIKKIGIASAGPMDVKKGLLLDPTNFASEEGTWGIVPLCKIIKTNLKRPTFLENDAAASILAEHWVGSAKKSKNAMVLTLGTGLGTGIICNGELVRAGRDLHPEAGHMIIHYNDSTAPCGCGNLGCAEAYLSGRNFSRRARTRFGNANLTAKDITDLARKRDPRALAAFEEYAEIMAIAINNYARIYCPEMIIFAGSFANAADLFMPSTQHHLDRLLAREKSLVPKLTVSKLHNASGLLGGAYVAFNRK
jgi:glucokinase